LIKDRTSAIEQGYFFASKRPVLDTAFGQISAQIKSQGGSFDLKSTDDYMSKTNPAQRRAYFDSVMKSISTEKHLKMAAYFYLLESYISSFEQQKLSTQVSAKIEDLSDKKAHVASSSSDGNITPAFISNIQDSRPWTRLISGYGIPLPGDFSTQIAIDQTAQKQSAIDELSKWIQTEFKDEIAVYQQIGDNETAFRKAIVATSP
jgi:hypothetical protein